MKLALYRKYRSTSLDDVIGQEHITTPLKNAVKQKNIQHAYLFTGSHGIGKTSVARIFAHDINGFTYSDEAKLDIIEIDGASNRKIEEIRNLRERIHIAPSSGAYKVYIIDEVHMLTKEAFNALLKTLEEPPEHAVFILATTEPAKLPATIISRTQRYHFKKAQVEDIKKHLTVVAQKEKIDVEQEALELVAKHSNNSFRDSLSILDQLSANIDTIDVNLVEDVLGLVASEYLEALMAAVSTGNNKELRSVLEQIYIVGTTPHGLAMQLSRHILTSHEEFHELAKDLLQLSHFSDARLGLLVTLLSACELDAPKPIDASVEIKKTPDSDKQLKNEVSKAQKPQKDIQAQSSDDPAKTHDREDPPKKITVSTEETERQNSEATSQNTTTDSNSSNTDAWKSLLETAKQEKMKIYPILRLATPAIENENSLTSLTVKFPLHKKKLEESQCKSELAKLTNQHLQDTAAEVSILISTQEETTPKKEESVSIADIQSVDADTKKYDNIKQIMGGGEAVTI